MLDRFHAHEDGVGVEGGDVGINAELAQQTAHRVRSTLQGADSLVDDVRGALRGRQTGVDRVRTLRLRHRRA